MAQQQRKARELRVLARLKPYVVRHARLLLIAGLTLPAMALTQLIGPYILRLAIDRHIAPAATGQPTALDGLWSLIALLLGALVVETLLRFAQIYLMQVAGQRIMHDLRMSVFEHIQKLSLAYFDHTPIGRVMTRVTSDVETLNELMSQGIVAMARDVVMLFGIVAVMLWIDWRLTLASFVVFPLLIAILTFLRTRLRRTYDRSRTLVARLNSFLQESITGMAVIQAFSQEETNQRGFRNVRDELLEVDLRGVGYSSFLSSSVQAATTVSTALVLAYGGFEIIGGAVTIGVLVQFLEYMRRFYMPLEDLSDKYDSLQRAAAASKKIFALLDVEPGITQATNAVPLDTLEQEIRFNGVFFSYPLADRAAAPDDGDDPDAVRQAVPVLKNLSFSLRRGEKVALVGSTGSGKSSIVKLLQRLYEPQAGTITIDGVDVRQLELASLRRFFGTVPQDVFLFTDSIAANIGLSVTAVDGAKIARVAETVAATEFIGDLPDGFETELGERGVNLSFGERQLLAFARALAADPEVLVLDEATSSVDSETEAAIQRAMWRVVSDRTALIIAHRLSTIREVDRILVLHHGEICEQGTHEELLRRDGVYATLYRLQYQEQSGA